MEVGSQEGHRQREAGALVPRFPLAPEGQWQSLLLLQSDVFRVLSPQCKVTGAVWLSRPGRCGPSGWSWFPSCTLLAGSPGYSFPLCVDLGVGLSAGRGRRIRPPELPPALPSTGLCLASHRCLEAAVPALGPRPFLLSWVADSQPREGVGEEAGSAALGPRWGVGREGVQAFHPGVLQRTLASPWAILKRDG